MMPAPMQPPMPQSMMPFMNMPGYPFNQNPVSDEPKDRESK